MVWTSHPVNTLSGIVRAPGDKSCSHRALILGGLAHGASQFSGLLEGEDVLRTGRAMAQLGAKIEQTGPGAWRIEGAGQAGLATPKGILDFGNSGTGSRLIMGIIAGHAIKAELSGDASLRARPMNRILIPLRLMGAVDTASEAGRMPFVLTGSDRLAAIDYSPPQASGQVKSAILLAGLYAKGTSIVREARPTRDHSERMLRGFGAEVGTQRKDAARIISVQGGQTLHAIETAIPGDPSSAAFLLAAAMISPAGNVLVEGVMSNETRDGFLQAAAMMGARLGAEETGQACGERITDIQTSSTSLSAIEVPARLVPAMIDEFPILAVLAAFAKGETKITGAEELRVKETDRIKAIVDMLRVNGVAADETEDGFVIEGCDGPPPGGGLVETRGDHRIAMSALVMGSAAQAPVSVDDVSMIETSYPAFLSDMASLSANIRDA